MKLHQECHPPKSYLFEASDANECSRHRVLALEVVLGVQAALRLSFELRVDELSHVRLDFLRFEWNRLVDLLTVASTLCFFLRPLPHQHLKSGERQKRLNFKKREKEFRQLVLTLAEQ